jgi:hypothetical protein
MIEIMGYYRFLVDCVSTNQAEVGMMTTDWHLSEVSSENTCDVVGGVYRLLPVDILAVLQGRVNEPHRTSIETRDTDFGRGFELVLELAHSFCRSAHAESPLYLSSVFFEVQATGTRRLYELIGTGAWGPLATTTGT